MGFFDKIKRAFTGEEKTEEVEVQEKYDKGLEKTRKTFGEPASSISASNLWRAASWSVAPKQAASINAACWLSGRVNFQRSSPLPASVSVLPCWRTIPGISSIASRCNT